MNRASHGTQCCNAVHTRSQDRVALVRVGRTALVRHRSPMDLRQHVPDPGPIRPVRLPGGTLASAPAQRGPRAPPRANRTRSRFARSVSTPRKARPCSSRVVGRHPSPMDLRQHFPDPRLIRPVRLAGGPLAAAPAQRGPSGPPPRAPRRIAPGLSSHVRLRGQAACAQSSRVMGRHPSPIDVRQHFPDPRLIRPVRQPGGQAAPSADRICPIRGLARDAGASSAHLRRASPPAPVRLPPGCLLRRGFGGMRQCPGNLIRRRSACRPDSLSRSSAQARPAFGRAAPCMTSQAAHPRPRRPLSPAASPPQPGTTAGSPRSRGDSSHPAPAGG